jgi:hypothetical protein
MAGGSASTSSPPSLGASGTSDDRTNETAGTARRVNSLTRERTPRAAGALPYYIYITTKNVPLVRLPETIEPFRLRDLRPGPTLDSWS